MECDTLHSRTLPLPKVAVHMVASWQAIGEAL